MVVWDRSTEIAGLVDRTAGELAWPNDEAAVVGEADVVLPALVDPP